jgi:hypothetical protein
MTDLGPCLENIDLDWTDDISREVEMACSVCDALHKDVRELENVAAKAYAFTASSLRGVYDSREIVRRWFGLRVFLGELIQAIEFKREQNPICGIDTGKILEFRHSADERMFFHCPPKAA